MKKFIIKTGLIGGVIVLILLLLYWIIPVNTNNYYMAYKVKCQRLEKIQEPRIIFVGGSNLFYGLDSKRIQDSLNMEVINTGLAAPIGLKYMLDDISLYAKEGDIIVFAPEWQHFYTVMYSQGDALSTVMRLAGWKKWKLLNTEQLIHVMEGIPNLLLGNINSYVIKSSQKLRINECGDLIDHWDKKKIYRSHPKSITEKFDKDFGAYFIAGLKKLQTRCQVYMIPPSTCDKAFEKWKPQVEEVTEFLDREGFPFLYSPKESSFPENMMYDTDYHLNKKGVDKRTGRIIEALRPYVKPISEK